MKRTGYIITLAFLGLLWLRTIHYGLFQGHFFSLILCVIILAPVTFRVVYGYLLSKSNEQDVQTPPEPDHTVSAPVSVPSGVCFCPDCGAQNASGGSFCTSCGGKLCSRDLEI